MKKIISVILILFPILFFTQTLITFQDGMNAVVIENHLSPVIAISAIVKAGSAYEDERMNGAAHLLEHMLFNGTRTMNQDELYKTLDENGLYANATTRGDHVVYFILSPSNKFAEASWILGQMLFESTIPEDKLEKEKGIVLEELAMEKSNPDAEENDFIRETIFKNTPLSRPILGSMESIKGISREDLFKYYKKFYNPSNTTLLIVGDITPEDLTIKKILKDSFGLKRTQTQDPEYDYHISPEGLVQKKMDSRHNRLVFYKVASSPGSEQFFIERFNIRLLTIALKSELAKNNLSYEDINDEIIYTANQAIFSINLATPLGKNMNDYLNIFNMIKSRKYLLPYIEEAIHSFVMEDAILLEKPHYFGMMKAADLIHMGIIPFCNTRQKSYKYSMNDIPILFDQNLFIVACGPDAGKIAGTQSTLIAVSNTSGSKDKIYLDRIDITKKENASLFSMSILFGGGSERYSPELTHLYSQVILEGPADMPKEDFEKTMQLMGAEIQTDDNPDIPYDDIYSSPFYTFVRATCLPEYASKFINLIAKAIKNPRLDEKTIKEKKEYLTSLAERRKKSPSNLSYDFLTGSLFGESNLGKPFWGESANYSRIAVEDMKKFISEYTKSDNIIISSVANCDSENIFTTYKTAFPGIEKDKNLDKFPQWIPVKKSKTVEIKSPKEQGYVRLGSVFLYKDDDRKSLEALIEYFSLRIQDEIREKMGLAYSIGANLTFAGHSVLLTISAGTQKENVKKVNDSIDKIWNEFLSSDIKSKDLKRANGKLAQTEMLRSLSGLNQSFWTARRKLLGLTSSEKDMSVNSVKTKYLKNLKFSRVILTPLERTGL